MLPNSSKPYTFDRVVRIVISLLIIAAVIYFLVITKTVLVPFFVAWLIAYLINPIVLYTQKLLRIKNKLIAGIIVLIVGVALLIGLFWSMTPRLIVEFEKISNLIVQLVQNNKISTILPEGYNERIVDYLKANELFKSLNAEEFIGKVLALSWKFITESVSVIVAVLSSFIAFIYLIFILKDYETITNGAIDLIPPKYRDRAIVVINDVQDGMNRYYRGQSLVALLVGVMLAVGFQIISLPLGIFIGLLIGLLNLVPYLQILGIVPMMFASLLKSIETGDSFWLIFASSMIVLLIVQLIQDMILVPKIMGRVTGLNPAVILLSLSIWGMLLGVIGMIIALPFTSILLSYYKRFVINNEPIENLSTKNEK